jgi:hypothetical protein
MSRLSRFSKSFVNYPTRSLATLTTSTVTPTNSSPPPPPPSRSPPSTGTDYSIATHLNNAVSPAIQAKLNRYASVSLATYSRPPFILAKGKNCTVWDTEGREYLDFSGGIAVNALGHSDSGVQKVLEDQAGVLVHNSNLWHNEWAGELAILLVDATKQLGGMGYKATGQPFQVVQENDRSDNPSSGLKVSRFPLIFRNEIFDLIVDSLVSSRYFSPIQEQKPMKELSNSLVNGVNNRI